MVTQIHSSLVGCVLVNHNIDVENTIHLHVLDLQGNDRLHVEWQTRHRVVSKLRLDSLRADLVHNSALKAHLRDDL